MKFVRLSFALCCLTVCSLLTPRASAQNNPPNAPIAGQPAADEFRYDNLWELSAGLNYTGFPSGANIQHRAQLGGIDVAATQWITRRLGATADVRTNIGLGDANANPYGVNSPLFVETFASVGPEYRWVRTPAIGVSFHALAGGGFGTFNGHVPAGVTNAQLGVYPNGATWDLIGGANFDFNTASGFGVRISPNVITTDFGSDLRGSFSLTAGFLWRFGKF